MVDILATLALLVGVVMPFGYLLQTYEMYKNKSSKNVSIWAYIFFEFAFVVWLLYGIQTKSTVIIASYAVGLICVTTTIIAFFVYKKR